MTISPTYTSETRAVIIPPDEDAIFAGFGSSNDGNSIPRPIESETREMLIRSVPILVRKIIVPVCASIPLEITTTISAMMKKTINACQNFAQKSLLAGNGVDIIAQKLFPSILIDG